ncbi:hypothetical protein H0X09_03135 [Candidatus Saccharibacteria bacterium]|nr:hypothetical protein [Candidatus Saccharibacteria bacterium]
MSDNVRGYDVLRIVRFVFICGAIVLGVAVLYLAFSQEANAASPSSVALACERQEISNGGLSLDCSVTASSWFTFTGSATNGYRLRWTVVAGTETFRGVVAADEKFWSSVNPRTAPTLSNALRRSKTWTLRVRAIPPDQDDASIKFVIHFAGDRKIVESTM